MKFIEMFKDWQFWKCLIITEIIGILIFSFVISPLISTWDYKHNNVLLKKYSYLFKGGYNTNTNQIILYSNSTIDLRHELCHKETFNSTKNIYYQETICCLRQYFFWNKVNLTSLDYEN